MHCCMLLPALFSSPSSTGACPISSLHTCVSVFGTSKIGEMLRLCYMRGMPKPPPSSIYKLYCAKQLKAGLKMADVAIMWKTKVTEAEKESLRSELEAANLQFKASIQSWAISKHLPASDSYKDVAEAYCSANNLIPKHCDSTEDAPSSQKKRTKPRLPDYKT
ncbi:unnamed protein product [Dicrocoelium dendriticum]|nr:unnamed protein product [Dicrocoelium dendriticum]